MDRGTLDRRIQRHPSARRPAGPVALSIRHPKCLTAKRVYFLTGSKNGTLTLRFKKVIKPVSATIRIARNPAMVFEFTNWENAEAPATAEIITVGTPMNECKLPQNLAADFASPSAASFVSFSSI